MNPPTTPPRDDVPQWAVNAADEIRGLCGTFLPCLPEAGLTVKNFTAIIARHAPTPAASEPRHARSQGVEIKPVGFDRRDPNVEVRRAFIETIDGLYARLQVSAEFGSGDTSTRHLIWMCERVLSKIKTMPVDKMGRWVGFIQGVMVCHGFLDVTEERNRTRPIFERAYAIEHLLQSGASGR